MSWKAGTASECITPDEPLWLAGYLARREPSGGKISDLYASALALQDESGQRFVIASIDLIAVTKRISEPVYEAVRNATGLPRQCIMLAATHTHYGPEFREDKSVFFKVAAEYVEKIDPTAKKMADALIRVILAAMKEMEPVRIFARQSSAGFAHNRRRAGVLGGNASTEDCVDHDVPILDVVDMQGRRKSLVFCYACHNTTIPPEDRRYCADWAGFAKTHLRERHPDATMLFITGCAADQNPDPRGSVELSREYGKQLADAVHACLEVDGHEITGNIHAALEDVPLPLERVTKAQLDDDMKSEDPPKRVKAKFLLDQLDRGEKFITSYPAPIQVVRFGEAMLLIALSGETVVDWSHKFKREFHGRAPIVWVAGYCNDMYGYVPTLRIQREGGYEGGRANLWSWVPAPFTEEVEVTITHAVQRLVKRVFE